MSQTIDRIYHNYFLPRKPASWRKIAKKWETRLKWKSRNVWLTLERS
ncbi:hypothetical protein ACE1B6_29360 [Aerosakkonemataceae cyanobacterium BLCC-F154]|uniref:Uncharacterized protein n=1 Tax=Floridaenema fluviatile BLCC-F154 TaxID=3153640 RepID=A0ABV4YKN8_9CYAN